MVGPPLVALRAWFVLVVFAASLALPYLTPRHASLSDDAACTTTVLPGDAEQRIEGDRPARSDGHCAVCHWLRAVAGVRPAPLGTLAYVPLRFDASGRSSQPVMSAADLGRQLSRAPPVFGSPTWAARSR
ncbi:MAG TPA: hypothetical protein VES67_13205 [Vicinamibacterales bacterium]|nr:hypothetical protein [Vicinamibacterales bacterium]